MKVTFRLDGRERSWDCEPGEKLRDALERHGVTTTRDGCDGVGHCGACAVRVDGKVVNSCLLLAAQLEGRAVETVAAYNQRRRLSVVQASALDAGVVQCGYCTPAVTLGIEDLLSRHAEPSRDEVRDALSGIMCRCTGYEQFYEAVELAAQRLADPAYEPPPAPEFRDELRLVGKDHRKVDGTQLARGERAFVQDMASADTCHLHMLRSPHAHAYITHIDTTQAEALPGVVAVYSYLNTPATPYTGAGQGFPEPSPYDRRMFGQKVRHVGDRVAAVVAETDAIARAALELIQVDYEVLSPVLTIDDAAAEGALLVQAGPVEYVVGAPEDLDNSGADDRDGKIVYQFPIHGDPRRNIAAYVDGGIGDADAGFAEADHVIEREYSSNQIQSTPLEPHVVFTRMEGERLVIHASTQVPWHLRRIVASVLGIPENLIRVVKERVGGGFGAKQDIVLEEVAAWATWDTGRPVLWRYTREEEFAASRTRHVMTIKVKLGAKQDGTITGVRMDVRANTGPYGEHCLTVPMNAVSKSLPLFLCDHVKFTVTTYYSNIPPTGAYQGYGAPKGNFAMQMAAAEMAELLGMDPLAFIEKNRVREGSWLEILRCLGEGREGTPAAVSSCGLGPALQRGSELLGWGHKPASDDPDLLIGQGVATVQQGSGLPGLDQANATLMMNGDGTFILLSGGADLGTGLDTVSAKMAAEVLCTELDAITVKSGDTDHTPFDVGAYASSGTYFSGGAARNAAREMKAAILEVASELLGEPVADLELVVPSTVRGRDGEVTFDAIARHTQAGTGSGQLVRTATFVTDDASFPYGAHFAEVSVDRRTGEVRLRRYFALQDAGTPVNPRLALGQIYGGALKTIGHSLYEDLVLDATGKPLNPRFGDYVVPMMVDLPDEFGSELVDIDDPFGPFGAKSIAEISCNGAAPAIAAAIHDAAGIWIRTWPFTAEKVLRALGRID